MKTLDTRDLRERLNELAGLRDNLTTACEDRQYIGASPASTQSEIDEANARVQAAELEFGEDEAAELADLESLKAEIGREWDSGVTLIPERDFEDYAREYAEDIGAVDRDAPWPACHIDWSAAADSLRIDYTSATFQGTEYLYRS